MTPGVARRGAMEPLATHRDRWATATIWMVIVFSTGAWWWLHRNWFLSGDDYLFIADPSSSHGAFSFHYWWTSLQDDWMRRNGRLADGVLRLVLRPGDWFYPLFGPLLLTGAGVVAAVSVRLASRLHWTPLWMWVASVALIPITCWLVPGMTGDVVVWTAAAINYVLPLTMLMGSICVYLLLLSGRRLAWPLVIASALLVGLTDVLQEVTSWAMLLVALAALILRRGRLDARLWLLTGTAFATFILHMTAPGLWARSGLIISNGNHGFLETAVRGTAASASQFGSRTYLLWALLAALLVTKALAPSRVRLPRVALTLAGVSSALFALTSAWYLHRVNPQDDAGLMLVIPMALMTMLTLLAVGTAFLVTSTDSGPGSLLLWVGLVGSCILTFASGATAPRGHFIPIVLLLMTLMILLTPHLETLTTTQSLAAVLVITAVPSSAWFDEAGQASAANNRFVSAHIVAPLEAAGRGATSVVTLPRNLPYPAFAYRAAFLLERYETALRIYYDIPGEVTIRNP